MAEVPNMETESVRNDILSRALELLQAPRPKPLAAVESPEQAPAPAQKVSEQPEVRVYPEHPLTVAYKGRLEIRSWAVEERYQDGRLLAERVFSRSLNTYLWILTDSKFRSGDGLAVYYKDELAALGKKTLTQLRQAQELKLIFPGCRVRKLEEAQKDQALERRISKEWLDREVELWRGLKIHRTPEQIREYWQQAYDRENQADKVERKKDE